MIAALKGIGSVSPRPNIERTLDKLQANAGSVVSLREPIMIDLSSYYKGQLTEKIELIKRAVLETRMIEFDYYYEKGDVRRRIEPYFVIFQGTAWYVFGFCLERQDWRLFKLLRLWNLTLSEESYAPREIPPEKRDFNTSYANGKELAANGKKLTALFDLSVKYQLIEAYGLDCFTETDDGLLFELDFANRAFLIGWLLGFGDKVKVLEPGDIAESIKTIAENVLLRYK